MVSLPSCGGGDVEEDELVGALGVVVGRELHGVACVTDVDEVGALDDPTIVDVEARDESLQGHGGSVRSTPAGVRFWIFLNGTKLEAASLAKAPGSSLVASSWIRLPARAG